MTVTLHLFNLFFNFFVQGLYLVQSRIAQVHIKPLGHQVRICSTKKTAQFIQQNSVLVYSMYNGSGSSFFINYKCSKINVLIVQCRPVIKTEHFIYG
jgi:hypothetical protein